MRSDGAIHDPDVGGGAAELAVDAAQDLLVHTVIRWGFTTMSSARVFAHISPFMVMTTYLYICRHVKFEDPLFV